MAGFYAINHFITATTHQTSSPRKTQLTKRRYHEKVNLFHLQRDNADGLISPALYLMGNTIFCDTQGYVR